MTIHQIRNEISLGTRASGYYRQVFLITDTISEISQTMSEYMSTCSIHNILCPFHN